MSRLTEDERTAIYCYCNGWDKDGKPYFRCSKCSDNMKAAFGCGYDPQYSGSCTMKQAEDVDLHGICPGWWRMQPFALDVVRLRKWKANLGHPNEIPAKLLDAIDWLDAFESDAEIKRMEQRK